MNAIFAIISFHLIWVASCDRSIITLNYEKLCYESIPNCTYMAVSLPHITAAALESLVDPLNKSITIVEIHTFSTLSKFGKEFDSFITTRPWWHVREQPLQSKSSKKQSFVLHRISSEYESYSDFVASVSYPVDLSRCAKRSMCFSHQMGTWGNGMLIMAGHYGFCARGVFVPISTRTGNADEGVFLADKESCPHVINKWECLFLPSTTCTWPDVVTNCHSRDCVPEDSKVFFNSASASGVSVSREQVDTINKQFPSPQTSKALSLIQYHCNNLDNIITAESCTSQSHQCDDVHGNFALYGSLMRFNSVFRNEIQEVINDFRATRSPVFHPNMSCVAVHVRRDDRALPGVGMLDWCRSHTIVDKNGHKTHNGSWIDGNKLSFGQWADMGCGAQLPYGAATLEHFLNASLVLMPHNRNIFMMTDDPKWLKAEVRKYRLRNKHRADAMHIFFPPIRPNHRGDSYNASIDLWSSITLARQCQAVVGHLGSAAFNFIYRNLCFYHDNQFLKCPPRFSIGGP